MRRPSWKFAAGPVCGQRKRLSRLIVYRRGKDTVKSGSQAAEGRTPQKAAGSRRKKRRAESGMTETERCVITNGL